MRFRPAIFIAFVFAQFFFKFYNNGGNQKLKACSFQLRKNYFCMLHIECPIGRQSSITIFLIHPVQVGETTCIKLVDYLLHYLNMTVISIILCRDDQLEEASLILKCFSSESEGYTTC